MCILLLHVFKLLVVAFSSSAGALTQYAVEAIKFDASKTVADSVTAFRGMRKKRDKEDSHVEHSIAANLEVTQCAALKRKHE